MLSFKNTNSNDGIIFITLILINMILLLFNLCQIYLPTGTKIITSRNSGIFMNVDITPGLADFKNTEGLCGKFNLDKTDEPKTLDKPTYGNYYILRPEESINFRFVCGSD